MDPIKTINYKGLTVEIHADQDAESPREWDNLGTMVCFHRRYTLGDKHGYSNGQELMEFLESEKPPVILPLYLLDHSGLAMRTGTFAEDGQGWDTSNVGVIYVTAERIKKEYGEVSEKTIAQARHCLEGEVKTYSQYLEGDVYGYVVNDQDGEHLDSCWGFYGDDAEAEGLSIAKFHVEEKIKKHTAKLKAQIKNKVSLQKRAAL